MLMLQMWNPANGASRRRASPGKPPFVRSRSLVLLHVPVEDVPCRPRTRSAPRRRPVVARCTRPGCRMRRTRGSADTRRHRATGASGGVNGRTTRAATRRSAFMRVARLQRPSPHGQRRRGVATVPRPWREGARRAPREGISIRRPHGRRPRRACRKGAAPWPVTGSRAATASSRKSRARCWSERSCRRPLRGRE